ncbi:[FeFe] hydrogenase H-cluster radical SAM maturase HydG [Candidatus Woesearchaeota archaeon]|nr:[FeFe] hydrogenase H-cluster radical SAM maturase HydG [Candidatus Woesearchaeota archaeon]
MQKQPLQSTLECRQSFDPELIGEILRKKSEFQVEGVLQKAEHLHQLSLEEIAFLLQCSHARERELLKKTASMVREKHFGKRVTLFAPLYVCNACINECSYCAFRAKNTALKRIILPAEDVVKEAKVLEQRGFQHILLVFAEHPIIASPERIALYTKAIKENTSIRTISINSAPFSVEGFTTLARTGIYCYSIFQETYHQKTYTQHHVSGPKASYESRLAMFDRAISGGIQRIAAGVLYGLYDYQYETLALIAHLKILQEQYNIIIKSISVPRLKPALNSVVSVHPPYPVSDQDLQKIIAVLKIALPTVGITLSTREPATLRDELLHWGVTSMSAGSCTNPGGYTKQEADNDEQFSLADRRSVEEVMAAIEQEGFMPSFFPP